MQVTTMTIAMTTSSRSPIKLPTMMAMSMLLSSDSAAVVSVVVPSGEKQDFNYVSLLLITPTGSCVLLQIDIVVLGSKGATCSGVCRHVLIQKKSYIQYNVYSCRKHTCTVHIHAEPL